MRPALDAGVAIAGIRWGSDVRPGMALQVNLLADTLVAPGVLDEVHMAVVETVRATCQHLADGTRPRRRDRRTGADTAAGVARR
ncbi:hypothetical protein [Pseudonocardia sp. TRM90224]|uniref:hypothetical protein n=1 Tax=Pseudonocardia sp. TRM90224 TaxID=2812678 RepID=UPI001E2F3336|nr:hypothetical protein [Pseudonocardia sp. TRM90224]